MRHRWPTSDRGGIEGGKCARCSATRRFALITAHWGGKKYVVPTYREELSLDDGATWHTARQLGGVPACEPERRSE